MLCKEFMLSNEVVAVENLKFENKLEKSDRTFSSFPISYKIKQ